MQCTSCQAEIRDGVKFCESCGAKQETACPACGIEGPPGRRFCGECGSAMDSQPIQPKSNEPANGPERRHLTVMFCDLVGSTDMARLHDAEDVSDVIRLFNETAKKIIQQYDGYIARYVGDGILCYFGYPKAFEDSAERSVRVGLDLIDAVSKLKPSIKVDLKTRVGIASGEVIAGETVLGDAHTETLAIGSTPNLAARLQSLAEPNTVYVADSTHKLIRMGIEWQDQGKHQLKGYIEPQPVWRAMARSTSTALDAFAGSGQYDSGVIGRDRELKQIFEGYEKAKEGSVQVVQLVGEAGIGKSALVREVRNKLKSENHGEAILHCSNLTSDTPLFPIKQCLEYLSNIHPAESDETKSQRLVELFKESKAMDVVSITCIAQLIGISGNAGLEGLDLSPRQQYSRAVESLTHWIEELAQEQPLVLIIEDVHWIDPSTLDWINNLVETKLKGRVFQLITSRPEFRSPWDIGSNVDVVNVKRLDASACSKIISQIAGEQGIPEELLQSLLAKTEGIPLFVEELTNSLMDSVADVSQKNGDSKATLSVPDSLRDSLMARLDRTPQVRDLVQIAAVVGREFNASLISRVSGRELADVEKCLTQMEEAGVLKSRYLHSNPIWVFKHALLRDAAYESILRSKRREFHGKIADALIHQENSLNENRAEILASHLSAAGRSQEAITQWRIAANNAAGNWSNIEASNLLQLAVDELQSIDASEERRLQEMDLLLDLGNINRAAFGSGSAKAFATLHKAASLCREDDNIETVLQVLEGEFIAYFGSARLAEALPSATEMLRIGELQKNTAVTIAGHQCCGMQKFSTGKMEQARYHLEAALSFGPEWPLKKY